MNTKQQMTWILVLCLSASLWGQAPDLIVLDARINSMDIRHTGATALAVRDGRVLRLGGDLEISALAGSKTKIIWAKGAFLMPGFIDSHAHFRGIGSAQRRVKLNGASSYAEIIKRTKEAAKNHGPKEWITGRGWDQNLWPSKVFPTHQLLSEAFPNRPVALTRVDGHALLANKKAMEIARITKDTANPPGGEIIRDENGEATGVFVDTAESLIQNVVPQDNKNTQVSDMLAAQDLCFSLGITTMHDAGMSRRQVDILDELYNSKQLQLRLYVMLGVASPAQAQLATALPPRVSDHDGRLSVRALKIYADGALGSRGAALLESYADRDGHKGLLITKRNSLEQISATALKRGYQACIHAIGDRANRMVLDTWEEVFQENPSTATPRFRIEHAQILHHNDIPRFAKLGIIASMQTVHCTSDMAWVAARVTHGRAKVGAYAWRRLLDAGALVCNGTDAPVEGLTPFAGLFAAMTRTTAKGLPRGGWFREQCMTRKEALYAYTMAGAYAAFWENQLGSLSPGKFADFIFLDTNLDTCPPQEILTAKVMATFIAGNEVYRRQ